MATEPKPGTRTTEFWLSVGAIAATILMTILGRLDADAAAIVSAIISGLYSASRGWAKARK